MSIWVTDILILTVIFVILTFCLIYLTKPLDPNKWNQSKLKKWKKWRILLFTIAIIICSIFAYIHAAKYIPSQFAELIWFQKNRRIILFLAYIIHLPIQFVIVPFFSLIRKKKPRLITQLVFSAINYFSVFWTYLVYDLKLRYWERTSPLEIYAKSQKYQLSPHKFDENISIVIPKEIIHMILDYTDNINNLFEINQHNQRKPVPVLVDEQKLAVRRSEKEYKKNPRIGRQLIDKSTNKIISLLNSPELVLEIIEEIAIQIVKVMEKVSDTTLKCNCADDIAENTPERWQNNRKIIVTKLDYTQWRLTSDGTLFDLTFIYQVQCQLCNTIAFVEIRVKGIEPVIHPETGEIVFAETFVENPQLFIPLRTSYSIPNQLQVDQWRWEPAIDRVLLFNSNWKEENKKEYDFT